MKHSPIMTLGFTACLLMIAGTLSADTVENPAGHIRSPSVASPGPGCFFNDMA